jgi:hypothetical protein
MEAETGWKSGSLRVTMSAGPLNFRKAEYGGPAVPLHHCASCGRWMEDAFYRVNGEMVCTVCAVRIQSYLPEDTPAVFWRTVSVGAAVAAATSLLYLVLFRTVGTRGMGLGVAVGAIGVGYAVGKAMQTVAKGAGGRKYQWAASLLSYAAIAVAMTGGLLGAAGAPVWAYPMFVFAPAFFAFVGQYQMAGLVLLFAWIGVQWSWNMMRGHGVTVTGPFAISGSPGVDGETLKA